MDPLPLPYEAYATFKERYGRAHKYLLDWCKLDDHEAFDTCRRYSEAWQKWKYLVKVATLYLYYEPGDCPGGLEWLLVDDLGWLFDHFSGVWDAECMSTCPRNETLNKRVVEFKGKSTQFMKSGRAMLDECDKK
jgi:hypothetical protein